MDEVNSVVFFALKNIAQKLAQDQCKIAQDEIFEKKTLKKTNILSTQNSD
jgi:hypothetical protein